MIRRQFQGHRITTVAEAKRRNLKNCIPSPSALRPSKSWHEHRCLRPDVPGVSLDAIDKSVLALPEPKRRRDKFHLRFVASQPCIVCGRQPSDPHHLRFAQPRALGVKVSDEFTVPLCRGDHRQLHQAGNEIAWWKKLEIDALPVARRLWEETHPSEGRTEPAAVGSSQSVANGE
jgi:hypothetical protein